MTNQFEDPELCELYSAFEDRTRQHVFDWCIQELEDRDVHSVLDFGAGDGDFARDLMTRGHDLKILCYDPSKAMADIATRNLLLWPQIEIKNHLAEGDVEFDACVMHALLMCIDNEDDVIDVLKEARRRIRAGGTLLVTVTHPCFRNVTTSTTSTEFGYQHYLKDGEQFTVNLSDGDVIVPPFKDTHWSLRAVTRQLHAAGFAIDYFEEFADPKGSEGAAWLGIVARSPGVDAVGFMASE